MNLTKRSWLSLWTMVAMSVFPLAMLGVYYGDYSSSRNRELENGSARIHSFTHMYAEQVSRSLAGVDLLIDELTSIFNEKQDWVDWLESRGHKLLLDRKPRSLPQLRDTAIFDATGKQRFHSSFYPAPTINISDRPYFIKLRDGARRVLFGPYKGKNTGLMTYAMSRRIKSGDGNFAGVAFAAVELAQFQSTCWNGKAEDKLQAFLVNEEGTIVAECRPSEEVLSGFSAIGQHLKTKYPHLPQFDWRREGVFRMDEQLVSVSPVLGYSELSVVATLTHDAVLADWQADQRRSQLFLGLAMTIVLGCFAYILTQMRRQKQTDDMINELAFFDPLTHLPNRRLLMDRLSQAMTSAERDGGYGAVLFIDIDQFKVLNDTFGHDKGDLLLQQVAQRVVHCVRKSDTVARMGGDEFVIVLGNLKPSREEAFMQTKAVGEKIVAAINQTNQLGSVEFRSSASIGATLFVGQETSIDDLLRQADLAMYKAKETGRNMLCFFDPAMQTVVMERAVLENELRMAIQDKQFLLHYQPQVLSDGCVVGAEALVRWQHPGRGMVSPVEFIPLAEQTGLILALGKWVLETACRQLAIWATRTEMAHLTLAVNVSAYQFRLPDFVDQVLEVLDTTGVNPKRLKLELTETLLVDNVQDIIEKMAALKAKGVGFSLDDFGTGYSSLAYLKRLPLDQLKIDKSFVRDVLVDPNDAAIAGTIVALAQSLGLGVIAEGVETEAQKDFLATVGCLAYQGYFFSRPLPIVGFEQFVHGSLVLNPAV